MVMRRVTTRTRVEAGSASDTRGSCERRPVGCSTRLPDSRAIWEAGALTTAQTPSTGPPWMRQSHLGALSLLPRAVASKQDPSCSDSRRDMDLHVSVGGAPRNSWTFQDDHSLPSDHRLFMFLSHVKHTHLPSCPLKGSLSWSQAWT